MSATFTPGVVTNSDGSVTTTNADGSTTTVASDGTLLSSTPAPITVVTPPVSVSPGDVGTVTNADGTRTTTRSDGSTVTVAANGAPISSTPPTAVPVATAPATLDDVLRELQSVKSELDTFKANPVVAALSNVLFDGGPDRMSGFQHEEARVRAWVQDEFAKITGTAAPVA